MGKGGPKAHRVEGPWARLDPLCQAVGKKTAAYLSLLSIDRVHDESALGVEHEAEVLAGALDGNDICAFGDRKMQRTGHTAINIRIPANASNSHAHAGLPWKPTGYR